MENKENLEGNTEEQKVETSSEKQDVKQEVEGGESIEKHDADKKHKKTIKDLISVIIVLSGVAAGSFFVDIVQFITGSGYSQKALQETEVFSTGDKTWVSFEDPAIEMEVLTLSEEELEDCVLCDPTDVVSWLKRFMPTVVAKKVVADSPEGEELIAAYGLKSIPSFVFSSEVAESEFYEGEASVLFEEKGDAFLLNSNGLGIPVGKYLETPEVSSDDPQRGNPDADVKVVVYSDFECPYCRQFYTQVLSVVEELGEEILLVYKDMPLEFHPRSEASALAAHCAQDQGKFWEMGELLYENQQQWSQTTTNSQFISYAATLGLDTGEFTTCLEEERHIAKIQANTEEAGEFGISGVPATFVNGQFISGVVQAENLKQMILEELEK